jgi:RimJ/RimL family protein N-acetyltransferase
MRGPMASDYDAALAMWSDPEVTRFIGGKAQTQEESWLRFLRNAGHWALLGYGFWIATDRATGKWVGQVGFFEAKREMSPSIIGMPEAGWAFAPFAHGKGLATEAVTHALAWGDRHFKNATMACIIHPENAPSIRVAEKTGFREFARTTYHEAPTIVFHRNPAKTAG